MKKMTTPESRNLELNIIDEPDLEFRYEQKVTDPRVGLSVFGPYDTEQPTHPYNISYGMIGTDNGLRLGKEFFQKIQHEIVSPLYFKNERLWIPFPGFQSAFNSVLSNEASKKYRLDSNELENFVQLRDQNKRVFEVVNKYIEGIENILSSENQIDVIICIVPEIVFKNCRPKSHVSEGTGERVTSKMRRDRIAGQVDLYMSFDPSMYRYSVDFRRQLKARVMKYKVPIQILRESTLETEENLPALPGQGKSPLSDRAWNILTTLYYKAGGKPWKLSTSREGVCYVGIVYKRTDPHIGNKTACSAAQMFLDTGDGVVVRGDVGSWYSEEDDQFHLTREAAKNLLSKVLNTYKSLGGKDLKEIFLHYRAWLDEEEYEGFKMACPPNVKLVCIRIREVEGEFRLYREGTRPVLRGTMLKASNTKCFLYTSGYKPFLGTYDGWETPLPLRIDIQKGEGSITQVATDILGLTKLNFNACRLGQSGPVTIDFSDAVGEILVSNPNIKEIDPKFKFYI
jgi:hypothetical protein